MVEPRRIKERDIYVFAFGDDYRGAVKALYSICGAPARVPRWALGNWWSRYHAYTQEEYLELMEAFLEDGIPFTVATVDMDWHPSENLPPLVKTGILAPFKNCISLFSSSPLKKRLTFFVVMVIQGSPSADISTL